MTFKWTSCSPNYSHAFSSMQEWDYAYVHSFYHLSLAVSFVLLLPKKNRYAGTGQNAAKLSCFTLCCCVWYFIFYFYELVREVHGSHRGNWKDDRLIESKQWVAQSRWNMSHVGDHPNHISYFIPLQTMSPGTTKEKKDKPKKTSSRTVWTVPTEKPWVRGCSTPTLPLYNPPPSTPVKGTSISKLKEMNGWKWPLKVTTVNDGEGLRP